MTSKTEARNWGGNISNKENVIPKDLGIKIGTKAEAFWTKVKEEAERQLEAAENAVMYQKEVLSVAEKKIALEKKA